MNDDFFSGSFIDHSPVDLRKCVPGQQLVSIHGTILTYVGRNPDVSSPYPHIVKFLGGATGTRCDNGHVYHKNRLPDDEDIAAILPTVDDES